MFGGAVGRFNYTTTSTVTVVQNDVGAAAGIRSGDADRQPRTMQSRPASPYGLGMDVAMMPNVFLRGEWEYVAFARINGIRSTINTGRVGLGMRF